MIIVAVVALYVFTRWRRRRRRAAELAAAKRVDATDPDALASLSLGALDDLSRWKVVDVDNAVRTSANELALTIEEFGEQRTQPFTAAVDAAKSALSQAFSVRQQLDDAIPETRQRRRELLTEVIVDAARADRELESQREDFEGMRDLVVNAPSRLDALTQQVVDLTARVEPAEQRMTELHNEFDSAALASVATNVATAKDRLAFAEQNLGQAREKASKPVSGEQSALVDAVHAAESSLGQARSLLDAVDSAANDIRHAVATLPSLIADIQSGIEHADTALQGAQKTKAPHLRDLAGARDAAARALDAAHTGGSADPLASFTALSKADAELNRLLATVDRGAGGRANDSPGRWSRRCPPRSRGCTPCRTTSTTGGAASGPRREPGCPRRADRSTPRRTEGDRPQRSDHLCQQRGVAGRAGPVAGRVGRAVRSDGVHLALRRRQPYRRR